MLKQTHFPLPIKADLRDLKGYNYLKRISIPKRLAEDEALKVIKKLANNKVLGLNKIPNRILKRIAGVISALFTRIFQVYINQGVHLR
jgi:polysaccharide pyruvyl transferase WcaK-like protein